MCWFFSSSINWFLKCLFCSSTVQHRVLFCLTPSASNALTPAKVLTRPLVNGPIVEALNSTSVHPIVFYISLKLKTQISSVWWRWKKRHLCFEDKSSEGINVILEACVKVILRRIQLVISSGSFWMTSHCCSKRKHIRNLRTVRNSSVVLQMLKGFSVMVDLNAIC